MGRLRNRDSKVIEEPAQTPAPPDRLRPGDAVAIFEHFPWCADVFYTISRVIFMKTIPYEKDGQQ
jgi:hypothetical protein